MYATYTTRTEAIAAEIIAPIQASDAVESATTEYDIDAIADAVIITEGSGSTLRYMVDPEVDFWEVVEAHAR